MSSPSVGALALAGTTRITSPDFSKRMSSAGLDPVMLRERFGHRDLEFAGNLGHTLTLARAASLSTMFA